MCDKITYIRETHAALHLTPIYNLRTKIPTTNLFSLESNHTQISISTNPINKTNNKAY